MSRKLHMSELVQQGDFLLTRKGVNDETRDGIVFVCPRGQGLCSVPFFPAKNANGSTWHFDGNEDAPSLTPSINCTGGCKWHGHITKGKIV